MGTFHAEQTGGFRARQDTGSMPRFGPGMSRGARGPMGPPSNGYLLDRAAMQPFHEALARRHVEPVRIIVTGSSTPEGVWGGWNDPFGTSLDRAVFRRRWLRRLQDGLRAEFPAGVGGSEGAVPSIYALDGLDNTLITKTGAVARQLTWGGLGVKLFAVGNGGSVMWPAMQPFDRLRVWYTKSANSPGAANVLINGTVAGSINSTSATVLTSGNFADFTVARGSYPVAITGTTAGGTCKVEFIELFDGDGEPAPLQTAGPLTGRGVRVYDGAHSGGYTAYYLTSVSPASVFLDNGHWRMHSTLKPHLVIHMGGLNDWTLGRTGETFEADTRSFVERCLVANAGSPTAVLLVKPYKAMSSASAALPQYQWADMMTRIDRIAADTPEVAVLDLQDLWPELEVGGATNAGLMVEDDYPIHPNDAGHQRIADILLGALRP